MPKKKLDETPADAVTLDAEHLPPIGATITAYDTPWQTVTGNVIRHQEQKRSGLLQADRGGVIIDHGDRLFIQYGTKYTIHNA